MNKKYFSLAASFYKVNEKRPYARVMAAYPYTYMEFPVLYILLEDYNGNRFLCSINANKDLLVPAVGDIVGFSLGGPESDRLIINEILQ